MKLFGLSIHKTDTEETADASIASEDAVLQGASDGSSSGSNCSSNHHHHRSNNPKNSQRSIDFSEIRLRRDRREEQERGSSGALNQLWLFLKERLGQRDQRGTLEELWLFLKERLDVRYFIATVAIGLLLCGVVIVAKDTSNNTTQGLSKTDTTEQPPDDPFDFSFFTQEPTTAPTQEPTSEPSPTSSVLPDFQFDFPNALSSMPVSDDPIGSITKSPTPSPTLAPSTPQPTTTHPPSRLPSSTPTFLPTTLSQVNHNVQLPKIRKFTAEELANNKVLTFCVIADVPYTAHELDELPGQITTQTEGCEFLVHLGDIFVGDTACNADDYQTIQRILLQSPSPSFVVPGDNEWNDCTRGNIDSGWDHWTTHFLGFENNWGNHTFDVARQKHHPENFFFLRKRTLVIGLNIVGGRVHNATEWTTRLRSEFAWVKATMTQQLVITQQADGVVLMAHAHPSEDHSEFFNRLRVFLRDDLRNAYPVLYLHGDGHNFLYTPNYLNQPNLLRIQHEGGTNEPVLKILAGPSRERSSAYDAFQYDRQRKVFGSREKDRKPKGTTTHERTDP